jgi:hypothetical protein
MADAYAGWTLQPAAPAAAPADYSGWKLQPVDAPAAPEQDPRAVVGNAVMSGLRGVSQWANTPSDAMAPIIAQQKATNTGGMIGKESSDPAAAIASFTSGIPGFSQHDTSPEFDERMGRFREQHPVASFLLPAAGALGKPGFLPATSAPAQAGVGGGGLADLLEQAGIKAGRRALSGGGTISGAKALSDDAVREALRSGAIKFGGTLQGASERLNALREAVGAQKGAIIDALEKSGIVGPEAEAMAQQYLAEGRAAGATSMNPAVPRVYENAAEQLVGRPAGHMSPAMPAKPTVNGRLGLSQAEDLKGSLQDMAESAYRQMQPHEVGSAQKATASMMRQAVEDEIARQAPGASPQTQAIANQFVPVKQRLGNIIEASDVASTAANRASKNRFFSLSDYVAGAGGLATGEPVTAITSSVIPHFARTRGSSSVAAAAWTGSDIARKLTQIAVTNPQALGKFALPLTNAFKSGPQEVAATHLKLSVDPSYQDLLHRVAEAKR